MHATKNKHWQSVYCKLFQVDTNLTVYEKKINKSLLQKRKVSHFVSATRSEQRMSGFILRWTVSLRVLEKYRHDSEFKKRVTFYCLRLLTERNRRSSVDFRETNKSWFTFVKLVISILAPNSEKWFILVHIGTHLCTQYGVLRNTPVCHMCKMAFYHDSCYSLK